MAGIILSALAGAGEGAVGALDQQEKTRQQMELQQNSSALQLQNEKALLQAKEQIADDIRQKQATRISDAQSGIVNNALAQKYAPSDAAVAAADAGQTDAPLTDDQRAVIEQAKQRDRDSLMADPKMRTQAAIQTGDIAPTEAAKLASASEINQMKLDSLLQRAEDRNATMKEVADVRADALKYGYELRLQAALEKRLNGKIDAATSRMLITSEDANIRAATSQLNMLNNQLANSVPAGKAGDAQRQSIQAQMDELRTEIAESKRRKLDLFKGLNIVSGDDESDAEDSSSSPSTPAPAPAPAPAAKKPPLSSFMK
jgi:hypothetical protein